MKNPLENCTLCARMCGVDRLAGETGHCKAQAQISVLNMDARFEDEECIAGGLGTGAVYFSHCPLECISCPKQEAFCQDSQILLSTPKLADAILMLAKKGVRGISLISPACYAPQIAHALKAARRDGMDLPVICHCSAAETAQTIDILAPFVDVWLVEFKFFASALSAGMAAMPNYSMQAIKAIDAMVGLKGKAVFENELLTSGVLIRHTVLPGQFADSIHVIDTAFRKWGDKAVFSLADNHRPTARLSTHPFLSRPVGKKQFSALAKHASQLGFYCLIIAGEAPSDNLA